MSHPRKTELAAQLAEMREANSRLAHQVKTLRDADAAIRQLRHLESVGRLTAGLAHDLNNILVVVLSNAALLERELQSTNRPKSWRQRLGRIREAGERGARFTSQLLAYSGIQPLTPRSQDISLLLQSMLAHLRRTLKPGISISVHPEPNTRYAFVDAAQFESIVSNLVSNAQDAIDGQGAIRLRVGNCTLHEAPRRAEEPEPGEYVRLQVEDTGAGMSEEVLAHACEPFFTTKGVGEGSGLGLSQVFGFTKQSGGGLRIDTSPRNGTVVAIYLPSAEQPDAVSNDTSPPLSPPLSADLAPHTVLLVDDDHAVREVTTIMLEDLGYRVIEASGARAALEYLENENTIELLLTDYAMPGMNGAELTRVARLARPNLPVLFITGYARFESPEMDGAEILQKPFREQDLSARINYLLGTVRSSGSSAFS